MCIIIYYNLYIYIYILCKHTFQHNPRCLKEWVNASAALGNMGTSTFPDPLTRRYAAHRAVLAAQGLLQPGHGKWWKKPTWYFHKPPEVCWKGLLKLFRVWFLCWKRIHHCEVFWVGLVFFGWYTFARRYGQWAANCGHLQVAWHN